MMGGVFLQIDHCEFPDDVLYDIENNVWIKLDDKKHARIGITSVHAALAGKLKQVMFKPTNVFMQAGQAVATIESVRYFGAVRTPLTARLVEVNRFNTFSTTTLGGEIGLCRKLDRTMLTALW